MAGAHRNKCPHCSSSFPIRNSVEMSPLLRRVHAQCLNTECGFTASGYFQWDYELSPSGMPNPEINLPQSPNPKKNKSLQVSSV